MPRSNTPFDPALLDELLEGNATQNGVNDLIGQFAKALLERALQSELTHHLGHAHGEPIGNASGNERNGRSRKTLKSQHGPIELDVPRDRQGTFEPVIVKKHQTRFEGLDEQILALYARGMSTRDIQSQLQDLYGVEVSPTLISDVTDAVLDEVRAWQARPLDVSYPILYLDCVHVKIRKDGLVQPRAVYVALAVNWEGCKEVLGLWIADNEGAKFWLSVLTELKNRGVQDVLITCVDGLKGFPDAIEAVFPSTQVQLCVVHQVRYSLSFVSWKERKTVAADLRAIYAAPTVEQAERALVAFRAKYDERYPAIGASWARNWSRLTPFFAYPLEIRRVVYTTNAVESLNFQLRKVTKTKGSFPSEESALKVLFLAIGRASSKWSMPVRDWRAALNVFTIVFEGRVPVR